MRLLQSTPQILRDNVHDIITFDPSRFEQMLWSLVQTAPFQRLRRVRQLGFSEFVYDGATHTRFAHSIGVFHTARILMSVIEVHLGPSKFNHNRAEAALAAALLHDVGHGPFSHAFESVARRSGFKHAKHENVSSRIILNTEIAEILDQHSPGMAAEVAEIVSGKSPRDIYAAVVSSQFDADRLDYMRRDRLMTGVGLGRIDFTWLMENIGVDLVKIDRDGDNIVSVQTLVLGPKAIHAAEAYVLGLFHLYPTVYFHKTTRAAEQVFSHLLERVFRLCREGRVDLVGLPRSHPIVAFAENPDLLENALRLDDALILGNLQQLRQARDASVSRLAVMLLERKLPKAIDLRAEIGLELGSAAPPEVIEQTVVRARKFLNAWSAEQNSEIAPLWIDSAERVPYKAYEDGAGPLNQILISHNGDPVDLARVSPVVSSAPPFKLDRLYAPIPDARLTAHVTQTVQQLSKEARRQ